jgi:uracil-DNA glycosylase
VTARPTILFVGESPPAGAPPDFRPFDCASGSRLAKALGLVSRAALLDNVPMTNVFATPTGVKDCPQWDKADAARHAGDLIGRASTLVLLGQTRVAPAVGLDGLQPCTWRRLHIDSDAIVVPHPSGQSQSMNTAEAQQEVRRTIIPDLLAATNTILRAWHFRLDEPAVLADLGLALCPHDPALAAAALTICAEVWRAKVAPKGVALSDYRAAADVPMWQLGRFCRDGRDAVCGAIRPQFVVERSFSAEVRSRHKFAARTLPRPPSAEVRATYARLVALGVA